MSESEQQAVADMDRMAHKLALAFHKRSPAYVEFDDLLQVARMGILEGVRTYDPGRKVKLSTHAYNCALYALKKAVMSDTGLIKVPTRGNVPENLPTVTEMPDKWEDTCFAEQIGHLDETERRIVLERLMQGLNKRQQAIISQVFFQNLTYEEVARQMGITRQTVHYLASQALAKMRKAAHRDDIKYFDI